MSGDRRSYNLRGKLTWESQLSITTEQRHIKDPRIVYLTQRAVKNFSKNSCRSGEGSRSQALRRRVAENAATRFGHQFARPGNRFWLALYRSGFTRRLLSPFAERDLLQLGLGVTNVVARATAAASELNQEDFKLGGRALRAKVQRYRPRIVAVLGVGAYREAFAHPKAVIGEQPETIGEARVWVLPNPSGLNANYQLNDLVKLFKELRRAAKF